MQQVEYFGQARYVALTTFRRNGQAVTTPVWVAVQGSELYVYTGQATGKLKRIRHNQTVQLAPSNAVGQTYGSFVSAQARILSGIEAQQAEQLLRQKYGWQKRVMVFLNQFRKGIGEPVYLEITLSQ